MKEINYAIINFLPSGLYRRRRNFTGSVYTWSPSKDDGQQAQSRGLYRR